MGIVYWIRRLLPLYGEKKHHHINITQFYDAKDVKILLKTHKIGVNYEKPKTSLIKGEAQPVIHLLEENHELQKRIDTINKEIKQEVQKKYFEIFSPDAEKVVEKISPTILGLDNVKKATYLQLFSQHKVHILLLGDPGVGKTEILRAINVLAPIASFGLGSGTSSAGLTLTVSGKKTIPGLLPMADKGIACIDELNLLKARDRAGLLNSMEKGVVTYDKGGNHIQLQADVRLLATANPKADRFVSDKIRMIREQLPFEDSLISRFNLIFIVRRPDIQEFLEITKSMLKDQPKINFDDVYFIRDYIKFAMEIDVEFPKKLEPMLLNFIEDLKEDEKMFLQDISPRFVKGVIGFAKAKARSHLRDKVTDKDLIYVFKVFKACLYRKTAE